MAIKTEELKSGCIANAADDEPVFVLRAQDVFAAYLVRQWADMAWAAGTPQEKVSEAYRLAAQMQDWPNKKIPD